MLRIQYLSSYICSFLFFFMIIVPTSYMLYKAILLLLLFLFKISSVIKGERLILSRNSFIIITLIIIKGVGWIFYGIINHNPTNNLLSLFPFHVVWPVVYLLLISHIKSDLDLNFVLKIIVISHVFIVFYNLYCLLTVYLGGVPINIFSGDMVFEITPYSTGIASPNLQQLIFTTPFLFTLMLSNEYLSYRRGLGVVMVFTILLLLFSGRGMMFLTILFLPIIPFLLAVLFKQYKLNVKYYVIFFIFFIFSFFIFDLYEVISYYYDAFIANFDASSDYTRFNQREVLISEWLKRPILGHGLGAVFYESVERGYNSSFESQYHADLAFTGIMGFSIFLFYIFSVLFYLLRYANRRGDLSYMACFIGLILFLIASSTNPFLASFDRMWPLFLCIAIINLNEIGATRLNPIQS